MVPVATTRSGDVQAKLIKVQGIVQGVGFRPFVYQIAQSLDLKGWVLNDAQGVTIHWEGSEDSVAEGIRRLLEQPPPLAKITDYRIENAPWTNYASFYIQESHTSTEKNVLISPDVGTCADCQREFNQGGDRRQGYGFTNCTNCGPRFTIIKDRPYDRKQTSMHSFSMCQLCEGEYQNPLDRRFHAQPNCCPECGPQWWIVDKEQKPVSASPAQLLQQGYILAVKGLGGFHLACDARNSQAVSRLRQRKKRDFKPFALMANNLDIIRYYCHLSAEEEKELVSPARPIVLLHQKRELPEEINKGLDTLGVMLPYTPLHWLLFTDELPLLVMTSANLSGNPLVWDNDQALATLQGIADFFLLHSRDIINPCDDSVGMVTNNQWQLVRRARGYVPLPITNPLITKMPILAVGGDLKSSFALAKGEQIFMSQHLGDLDNYLNLQMFQQSYQTMKHLTGIEPKAVVADLHPKYASLELARELAKAAALPLVQVQHHHAHLVSAMIDNGLSGPALGIICDGTGYGTDGNIWGFEFLKGDPSDFERLGHLEYLPLPGGEASVKRPLRIAYSYFWQLLGEEGLKEAIDLELFRGIPPEEQKVLQVQLARKLNTIYTSSAGRLFDGVSSMVSGCHQVQYEGQAAMELEALARRAEGRSIELIPYSVAIEHCQPNQPFIIKIDKLWQELMEDLKLGTEPEIIAGKFHLAIAEAIKMGAVKMRQITGLEKVVLSGGVFQNRLLNQKVASLLRQEGLKVFQHVQAPPNDGGLAIGQIAIGNEVL